MGRGRTTGRRRTKRAQQADILIVGGGPIGLTLGLALAQAGVAVRVIERADPRAHTSDGRTTAVAAAGQRLYLATGVWPALAARACAIDDIRIGDGAAPSLMHYDHRQIGVEPFGWIVDNGDFRRILQERLAELDRDALLAPVELVGLERDDARACATLGDGFVIEAALVVACDGRNSQLREAAAIPVTRWSYGQSALVCTARHERPHEHVAHERFLPAGPFALLPMQDDADGRHRSSIVWTEGGDRAGCYARLAVEDFDDELTRRGGDLVGRMELAGGRFLHPLALIHAERVIDRRLAQCGDAAHALHPVAGQGFNLGLRDVAALAEIIVDAKRLGLDPGRAEVLAAYPRWRSFDNLALAVVTDGLVRLFSNDLPPLKFARRVGLSLVERLPPAKRMFMRQAMGLSGDLPRLLEGTAL